MRINFSSLVVIGFLFLLGCVESLEKQNVTIVGYKPVYSERVAADIRILPSQTVTNPGKIYRYGNLLLINEINRGIHVFNNSDRNNPSPIAFIEILGNSDVAVKDSVFYVDHMGNLDAVKINQFVNVEVIGSLPIQNWLLGVPPPAGYYFECVDMNKGVVTSWAEVMLTNPACYALERTW